MKTKDRQLQDEKIKKMNKETEFTVSSTNKTDRPDITKILLKVALNTTTQPKLGW
jgi:hypothetical protein